jgi:membrane protease YdiL (CAAX protease family)
MFESQPAMEDNEPAQLREVSARRVWCGLALALAGYGAMLVTGWIGRARLTSDQVSDPARLISLWSPALGLGVIAIAALIERQPAPLQSLGLRRPTPTDVTWGMLFFAAAFETMVTLVPFIDRSLPGVHMRLDRMPMLAGWTAIILASTMEELFFRGYLIERIERVSGTTALAAGASLVMFALGHLPAWGPAGVARNLVWGGFITALYVWRRNLAICVMMHLLQDAFSLPVLWYAPLRWMIARPAG